MRSIISPLTISLFSFLILASCASSSAIRAPVDSAQPQAPPQTYTVLLPPEVSLWLDSQQMQLGAYTVTLTFDPEIVEIKEIRGGSPPFDGPPFVNRKNFATGKVKFMAFHTEDRGPTGQTLAARIQFKGLQPGVSELKVEVETMATPDGKSIPPRYFLTSEKIEVLSRYRQ